MATLVIETALHIEENRRGSGRREVDVRARCVLATAVVLGWAALAQSKDLAVISNKSNNVTALSLP